MIELIKRSIKKVDYQILIMKNLVEFLFESGMLWRVKRSGWWFHGVDNPESVADHSHRAMMIGWILADMENADKDKVIKMLLLHDMPETRIGDISKYPGKVYLDTTKGEKRIIEEQSRKLPEKLGKEYKTLMEEFEERKTKEAIIAKDADTLELLVTAKERSEWNNVNIDYWFSKKYLKTKSANKIAEQLKKMKKVRWWDGIKKE